VKDTLNILYIASWYPTNKEPFSGNFVKRHAKATSHFANVWVIHIYFDDVAEEHITKNYSDKFNEIILCLPRKHNILSANPLKKLFVVRKKYQHIIKTITQENSIEFDIIHANVTFPIGIIAYLLSKRYNIPYVITEHWTGYTPEDSDNLTTLKLISTRWLVARSKKIITVSENLKKSMMSIGIKGSYKVIPNVVDIDLFASKYDNKKPVRFIHISTLNDDQKNISGILRAVKMLAQERTDFTIQIIGNGDIEPYLSLQQTLNLNNIVTIGDGKPIEEVAELMRQSDVFLLFSNYENLPCVISEAFAVGLPVISTDVGGINEMINDTNGLLIEPRNEKMLCEKMSFIIDNYNKYNPTQIRNDAIKRYSYHSVGKQFINIYKQITKS